MLNTRALNSGSLGSKTATPNTLASGQITSAVVGNCRAPITKYARAAQTLVMQGAMVPRHFRHFALGAPVSVLGVARPTVHLWRQMQLPLAVRAWPAVRGSTRISGAIDGQPAAVVTCRERIYHQIYGAAWQVCGVVSDDAGMPLANQPTSERVIRVAPNRRLIRVAAAGKSTGV